MKNTNKNFSPLGRLRGAFLAILILVAQATQAQLFTETDVNIHGVDIGSIAWGDYNNDGLLDFTLTGSSYNNTYYSAIYTNKNNTIFSVSNGVVEAVQNSSLDFGDFNNDNFLDLILSGFYFSNNDLFCITKIYINSQNGQIEEQVNSPLTQSCCGEIKWGDYSNDAYNDIFQIGLDNLGNVIAKIYKNNKNETFAEQTQIEIAGKFYGNIAWGDYNNDCFLDLIVTGSTGYEQITKIYKNNGHNNFSIQNQFNFVDVMEGTVTWGDYNNDGYLDLIVGGNHFGENHDIYTKIYKNVNGQYFEELYIYNLSQVSLGQSIMGDFNNDGLLDFLLTGYSFLGIKTEFYTNNGDDSFSKQTDINIPDIVNSSVAWGDYNNDNRLDLLLTGATNEGFISKLYRNECPTPNQPPLPITGMQTEFTDSTVIFSWDEAIDPNQPSPGLNYNFYVYEEGNMDTFLRSPQAFPYGHELNGKRLVPKRGDIQGIRENGRVSYFLIAEIFEPCKKYYWSVQAIDASFDGGAFPPEQSFVYDTIPPGITCRSDQTINLAQGETEFVVSGYQLDPLFTGDNCEYSRTNNINYTETLGGEHFAPGTYSITWTVSDLANQTATCSMQLTVNAFVQTPELITEDDILIYPNPATNTLTIEISDKTLTEFQTLSELDITIYDITGREVIRTRLTNPSGQKIDVSQLAKGTYLLKIGDATKVFEIN